MPWLLATVTVIPCEKNNPIVSVIVFEMVDYLRVKDVFSTFFILLVQDYSAVMFSVLFHVSFV